MTSIHALQSSTTCDKLLESMRALRPLIAASAAIPDFEVAITGGAQYDNDHDNNVGTAAGNHKYNNDNNNNNNDSSSNNNINGDQISSHSTISSSISAEDLELLDISIDQDILLALGSVSSPNVTISSNNANADQISTTISDDWDIPCSTEYPCNQSWKPSDFLSILDQNGVSDHIPAFNHSIPIPDHHHRHHQNMQQLDHHHHHQYAMQLNQPHHELINPLMQSSSAGVAWPYIPVMQPAISDHHHHHQQQQQQQLQQQVHGSFYGTVNIAAAAAASSPNDSSKGLCNSSSVITDQHESAALPAKLSAGSSKPATMKRGGGGSSRSLMASADNDSDFSDGLDDIDSGAEKLGPGGKSTMSKNLVSERRRRKKLNERLYSLRAIVPKISKMDKASIVGDAITYLQDLQKQVADMQNDIQKLQNLKANEDPQSPNDDDGDDDNDNDTTPTEQLSECTSEQAMNTTNNDLNLCEHKVLEFTVSEMDNDTYHLRIHCKNGPGVLVQITRALESIKLNIINANLTSIMDHVLNTVVIKVSKEEVMDATEIKKVMLEKLPTFGLNI